MIGCSYALMLSLDLIDTLWNVKDIRKPFRRVKHIDLIDTLWNVKMKTEIRRQRMKKDLIDTLWNVKSCNERWETRPVWI